MDFAYPRPLLQRAAWTSLNGDWRFCFDDDRRHATPADVAAWPLTITVPFAPETARSGIHDRGFHSAC